MKGPPRARRAEIDFSLLYAGLFLALGAQMAFSQLWYQDRGLDAAEIGRLNTLAILTRIAAGVALPLIADATGRRAETLIGLALLGAAAALAHLAAPPGLGPGMIAVTLTLAVAYAGLLPLGDAYGFAAGEREGFSYRRARAVGSFAFLAATALVGEAVAGFGIDAVFVWIAVAMALAAAAAARA
ncbi:MAG: MFS transporter, partial [Pseudomonadota bacterium]